MPEDTTSSQQNQQDTDFNLNDCSIERCPHDRQNPYVMVNSKIIRNSELSFEARGLLTYLLSFDHNWNFTKKHIMLSQNIKKDKLNSIFQELIQAGHIKVEKYNVKGLQRTKYIVSEDAKFKEINTKAEKTTAVKTTAVKSAPIYKDEYQQEEVLSKNPKPLRKGPRSLRSEERKTWAKKNEYKSQCGYAMAMDDRYVIISGCSEKSYWYAKKDPFWESHGLG